MQNLQICKLFKNYLKKMPSYVILSPQNFKPQNCKIQNKENNYNRVSNQRYLRKVSCMWSDRWIYNKNWLHWTIFILSFLFCNWFIQLNKMIRSERIPLVAHIDYYCEIIVLSILKYLTISHQSVTSCKQRAMHFSTSESFLKCIVKLLFPIISLPKGGCLGNQW